MNKLFISLVVYLAFFMFSLLAFSETTETPQKSLKKIGYMDSGMATAFWNGCATSFIKDVEVQQETIGVTSKVNPSWVGNYCYNLMKQISKHPESATDEGLKKLYSSPDFANKYKKYRITALKEADKKFSQYEEIKTSKKTKKMMK